MIKQKEIKNKAKEWLVPADTVDKDYVLGHFLAVFPNYFKNQIVFKGETCLRKCWISGYRFSEDLDFTAIKNDFVLNEKELMQVCNNVEKHSGIQFSPEKIEPLVHEDQHKGYQVYIKYWGANHSRNQQPLPPERWQTRIKLEISTEEIILCETEKRPIDHPYSDELLNKEKIDCYPLKEIVAEKLRSLKQRSYTAPRDFYDLYFLTYDFKEDNWQEVKPLFLKKMKHKNLAYDGPETLFNDTSIQQVIKQWSSSLKHQVKSEETESAKTIIETVKERIVKNL